MTRILIVGGYGAFGARAAERLAREPALEVVIAGRSAHKAAAFAAALADKAKARVAHTGLDARNASAEAIRALEPRVVINASGPFQVQGYGLARACIGAGCHYVDLADARPFVTGITELDAQAKAAGVAVVSGASSVPGLSSAVVQAYAPVFQHLQSVEIGISPGNSFDPGVATAASILSQAGKPHFELRRNGTRVAVFGWQGLRRHCFPEIGARWMGSVDVPDLDLLPAHYSELRTVRFSAGVEVAPFHLGLWSLSWLPRARLVRNLGALSGMLLRAKRMLRFLGSDRGMFVILRGRAGDGSPKTLTWTLIARSGHGPYVPAMASVILAKRLAAGRGPEACAKPCFGLFRLSEFEAEVAGLDISCRADLA